jgi:hypothetical protein
MGVWDHVPTSEVRPDATNNTHSHHTSLQCLEIRTLEAHTLEVHTLEVHTLEVHTLEVHTLEVHTLGSSHTQRLMYL